MSFVSRQVSVDLVPSRLESVPRDDEKRVVHRAEDPLFVVEPEVERAPAALAEEESRPDSPVFLEKNHVLFLEGFPDLIERNRVALTVALPV